jgi:hypothetical protein
LYSAGYWQRFALELLRTSAVKFNAILLVAASMLFPGRAFCSQESVCELFSHLTDDADGRKITLTGDLIISGDLAAIGAADCDNQYISNHSIWPTGLSLRPSADISPEKLLQFREAAAKADGLRLAAKNYQRGGNIFGSATNGASGRLSR